MARTSRRPRTASALPGLGIAVWFCAVPMATAQGSPDPQLDRERAEEQLVVVLEDIDRLRAQLADSRSEHRKEQERLREIDLEIQAAGRELRGLRTQQDVHRQELERLEAEREAYLAGLEQRMEELARQLRAAYAGGRQSRIKLVLNQDDPLTLGRMLAYYDYFNRAQVQRIGTLKEALATLDSVRQSIDGELARLAELARGQQALLDRLRPTRERRNELLTALATRIGSGESRLQELERNRQDLETLIERLSDVLADIPADLGSRRGLAQHKGRLPMPLSGPVLHAYGQGRSGGLHWQGWLIGAEPGAEVGAVAYGRVAFADWLRGYGLLLIIDHGQGYMSLYGHNETLLHEVGTWVEPGEIISIVGADPGSGQGLYFELRQSGKAIDPAAWLDR